jgi:hypothetical protein
MALKDENEKAKSAATQEFPSTEESNSALENDDPNTLRTEYPSGLRLTSLIVGLCLAVLLVALVSIVVDAEFMPCLTIEYTGQHNHCDCDTSNFR